MRNIGKVFLSAIPFSTKRLHRTLQPFGHEIELIEQGHHFIVCRNLNTRRYPCREVSVTDRRCGFREKLHRLRKSCCGECRDDDGHDHCKNANERNRAGDSR